MADILTLIGVTDASALGVLSPTFKTVQRMTDTYQDIKLGRKRCKLIIQRAALIIKEVHGNLQKCQYPLSDIVKLGQKLEEIQTILQRLADMSFLKALLRFEDINKSIERANSHLDDCSQLFLKITVASLDQAQNNAAKSDHIALQSLLKKLSGNYAEIQLRFDLRSDEQEDQAMAVMERELRNVRIAPEAEEDMPVEMQIMQKTLECIKATTGRSASEQNKWLITEYDLEYCGTIGGGAFATVSKAKFRYMTVAVKTFRDAGKMRGALEREIEIWSRLHHDHIVPFYGACTMTSQPFIVLRYMQNGNLVQYLASMPNADRTKLIFEVSLGMYYLHEEYIVHGDLKGANILVDDSGKACITDFGLSEVCSPETTGTQTSKIAGTLRYLAPEALKGQPLSFDTDVYAFGMLIYEIFTGDVPFIREPDYLVREGRVELHRPSSSKVDERGFNDTFWKLLSDCISHKPSARPRFKTILPCLDSLKKVEPSVQSVDPDPMLGVDDKNLTDWGFDTEPSISTPPATTSRATLPTRKSESLLREQSNISYITHDMEPHPWKYPMRVEVTHKCFGATFAVSAGQPGVYLGDTITSWQTVTSNKRSLLYVDGNRFWYSSNDGQGKNSWELNGAAVTVHTSVNTGVCHLGDAQMAEKWFRLQLNYARDGSLGDWKPTVGDWSYTEQSWRRLVSGMLQQTNLVEGAEPTDWKDIDLPKRFMTDNYAGTENCIVCITDPGKRAGRFCCKMEGRRIAFETYRRQGDKGPTTVREETYPSEESAGMTFKVLKAVLENAAGRRNKMSFFSF